LFGIITSYKYTGRHGDMPKFCPFETDDAEGYGVIDSQPDGLDLGSRILELQVRATKQE
jgi:hypothetical protein